jgi:hypothetical protein
MKRFSWLCIASCITILLVYQNSFAIGLGGFIDASKGSGNAEWESDYNSWDINTNAFAFGFVLDTAPTNEKNFNYRLNVGFARQDIKDSDNFKLKSRGVYAENIFGFAIIKTEDFRWWCGPLLRVGYYSGKSDILRDGTTKVKLGYADFGTGAVTGLNLKLGNTILSPSIGFRYDGFAGEGKTIDKTYYGNGSYKDFVGSSKNIFANIAVLF